MRITQALMAQAADMTKEQYHNAIETCIAEIQDNAMICWALQQWTIRRAKLVSVEFDDRFGLVENWQVSNGMDPCIVIVQDKQVLAIEW